MRKRGRRFPTPPPNQLPTIIKKNADETPRLFCGIVPHQMQKKWIFRGKPSTFPWKSNTQTCPKGCALVWGCGFLLMNLSSLINILCERPVGRCEHEFIVGWSFFFFLARSYQPCSSFRQMAGSPTFNKHRYMRKFFSLKKVTIKKLSFKRIWDLSSMN